MSIKNKLKKHLTDNKIKHSTQHPWLKKFLNHPALWKLDRESIARGVAVGLFTGMIPLIPFQTIIAIICCILIEGNLPVAFLVSWISNPLTIIPLAYLTFFIGNCVLGQHEKIILHDVTWHWDNWHSIYSSFSEWIVQFSKPFFIGLPIVALGTAIIGYLLVTACWYAARLFQTKTH